MLAGVLAGWVYAQFQIVSLLQRKGRSKAFGHFVGACFSWLGACAGMLIAGGALGFSDDDLIGKRLVFCVIGLLILAPFAYVGRTPKAAARSAPARTAVSKPTATPSDVGAASQQLRTSLQQHTDAVRQAMRSRSPAEREKIARAKTEHATKPSASAVPLLPADLVFDYIDRDGVVTSRSVLGCRIEASDTNQYLTGFCEARSADRTFRIDRISGRLRAKSTGDFFSVHELLAANPDANRVVFDRAYFRNRVSH